MTKCFSFLLVLSTLALLAGPAIGSDYSIFESGGEISWIPNKAYGSAQLVVSGPDGFRVESAFSGGETPRLSLFDGFEPAADGGYTWSLTVVSEVDESLREQMEAARAAGDEDFFRRLKAEGTFSSETFSGHFVKAGGELIVPETARLNESLGDSDVTTSAKAVLPTKAQVFNTDVIIDGSQCVGVDCVSSESFGFDTVRLKENNLRIHFDDTSSSATFPKNDWRITINDSTNGGAEYFSIDDATNNKRPFTIEANSPSNTLYVDKEGRIGVQTNNPAVMLHVKDGNTPAMRLEQDGSNGFQTQTWDIAGNETNFFVRDVSNSSTLPFRILDGAIDDGLVLDTDGVGIGLENPSAALHVQSSDGDGQLLLQETNNSVTQRVLLKLENKGIPSFQMEDTDSGEKWAFSVKSNSFEISKGASGAQEFIVDGNGNVTITGTLTTAGDTYPDYVFRDGYELMSLDEVEAFIETNGHLPNVKSEEDVEFGKRINMTELGISLLEKVEELTLYTIDQHKTIRDQKQLIESLEQRLSALEAR